MSASYPVIGELRPNRHSELLKTGFQQFDWNGAVGGLAKVQNNQLHILAVHAEKPGTGQFRHFMNECQAAYSCIRVWSVWSGHLRIILRRYGFIQGYDVDQFGDFIDVWDWEK